ncbi:MAG: hypothetical protein AB7V45_15005 [Candidatus Krumholzibacteriia bacterium]
MPTSRKNPTSPGSRRRRGLLALALAAAGTLLGTAHRAEALPRYTPRYGQSCILCHANPTGGGMRSLYASQYIVPEELAAGNSGPGEGLADFSPALSPNVTVGADVRSLVYQEEGGEGAVLAMQGDLYLHLQTGRATSVYLEQGRGGTGEAYGLVTDLPLDGYAKAGRFVPDFGWRFADHQMATRRYLSGPDGSDSPALLPQSGLEAGISPGAVFASASILEGGEALGDSYAARIMVQRGLGPLNLGLGASLLRRTGPLDRLRAAGGFWYLNLGPVTWLGEYDETRQEDRLGNLAAHELTLVLKKGLEARATYGFQDPDRALRSGARHRTGLGLAYMPRPYLAVQVMGNRWDVDEGVQVPGGDRYETDLVIHFFY